MSIITSLLPTFGGILLNNILAKNLTKALFLIIIIGLLEIGLFLFNLIITKTSLLLQKKIILEIRKKSCRIVLNLKIEEIKSQGQGKFLNVIKGDSNRVVTYLNNIKDSIILVFSNIGSLFVIFFVNKIIGIYYFICTLLMLLIHYYGIKKSIYYQNLNLEQMDENSSLMHQVIKGVKDIKVLKLKNNFVKKTDNSFEEIANLEYKSKKYLNYTNKITTFLATVCTGGMLLVSLILIHYNLLASSSFLIIFMYRNKVFTFSDKFASLLNNFGQFNLSFERISSILDYKQENFGKKQMKNYKGSIKFNNVSFAYDKPTLKNISFQIKPKTFNCLVGKTGSGKSTIFALLSKMYDVNEGNIFLDKYNINDLTEENIRNNITLVTQQPFLFTMSIKENLEVINDDFDNIKRCCKLVGIDEKINSLELGYDTILNEDGDNLSGGERQKLAIARALLTNCKVILLDEITNNLDKPAREDIKKLIEKLKQKYTIIMITHDLDMVKSADQIIVLEKGKIKGIGKHKDLLKDSDVYQNLNKGKTV